MGGVFPTFSQRLEDDAMHSGYFIVATKVKERKARNDKKPYSFLSLFSCVRISLFEQKRALKISRRFIITVLRHAIMVTTS